VTGRKVDVIMNRHGKETTRPLDSARRSEARGQGTGYGAEGADRKAATGAAQAEATEATLDRIKGKAAEIDAWLKIHGKGMDEGTVDGAKWILGELAAAFSGKQFPASPLRPISEPCGHWPPMHSCPQCVEAFALPEPQDHTP